MKPFWKQKPAPTPMMSRDENLRQQHRDWFRRAGVEAIEARFVETDEVKTEREIELRRENGRILYLYNGHRFRLRRFLHFKMAPPYLYWFTQSDPSVERIGCDLSDGQWPGFARFTYSTIFSGKVLLPDQHFFIHRGYEEVDRVADEAPPWEDRGDKVFWRGGLNNEGVFSLEPEHVYEPWVMQRARLAMLAKEIDGLDARFFSTPLHQEAQLEAAGLTGPARPWQDWAGDKYALDIDGYTNAWSNLMQRLRLGCCVLKVESQHGYRQWYYDKLVPYETYVPVKADMSDLAQQVDWVRSHDKEAREIAANGQAFARAMTFETETHFAARTIEENWQ